MPVLRFQFASAEVGAAGRRLHRCADPRFRHGAAARRRAAGSTAYFSAAARRACSSPRNSRACCAAFSAADRLRGRRRNHPGGEPRHDRARPVPRLCARRASIACPWARKVFDARALAALGRIHSADDTHRAVEELQRGETRQFQSRSDVRAAAAIAASEALERCADRLRAGACAYLLLPAHARARHGVSFAARRRCRTRMQPGKSKSRARSCWPRRVTHNTKCRRTRSAGARCRHNLNYWLFGDYVGIGAGAHGKLSLALARADPAHRQAEAAARVSGRDRPRSGDAAGERRLRRRRGLAV